MSSSEVSLIVLVVLLCGAGLGAVIRNRLPNQRLDDDSKQVITLGAGLVGTIAALVLGLLTASAKSSYDAQTSQVKQLTADVVLLNLLLEQYGPEARPARELLRRAIPPMVTRIWRENSSDAVDKRSFTASAAARAAAKAIEELAPQTDAQRVLKGLANETTAELVKTRALLFEQSESAVPMPFLVVLIFWLTILFISFSLHSRLNRLVVVVQLVLALSAAAAIFLILGMSEPFSGPFKISSAPLLNALPALGP
jgi:hypothetical protein